MTLCWASKRCQLLLTQAFIAVQQPAGDTTPVTIDAARRRRLQRLGMRSWVDSGRVRLYLRAAGKRNRHPLTPLDLLWTGEAAFDCIQHRLGRIIASHW